MAVYIIELTEVKSHFRVSLMHRLKSGQKTLFDVDAWLPDVKLSRLQSSWAGSFQEHVLPLLMEMEPRFARFYSPDHGAPNKPVAVVLGLLILKEMFDLSDAEVVARFEFDMQWHYALDTPPAEAHACTKTLYNFRQNLLTDGHAKKLVEVLVDKIIERWAIDTTRHRIDSTQIVSNMKVLSRLGLFVTTIEQFLARLARKDRDMGRAAAGGFVAALPKRFHENYLDRRGYFADAKSSVARRRLGRCAGDLWYLIDRFRGNKDVAKLQAYKRMVRLFDEQCTIGDRACDEEGAPAVCLTEPPEAPTDDSAAAANDDETPRADAAREETPGAKAEHDEPLRAKRQDNEPPRTEAHGDEPAAVVAVKDAKEIAGDSLQNPSDPGATFSGHKGVGYQTQIAETCHADNPFQVIDYVEVEGAHVSDQHAPRRIHENLAARGHRPEESFVDSGYVSGENIIEAQRQGIDLKGPVTGKKPDPEKLTLADFECNGQRTEIQRCPAGHAPIKQKPSRTDGATNAYFDRAICDECPRAKRCPTRATRTTRVLRFTPAEVATGQRRRQQQADTFWKDYAIRSGVEATMGHLKNDRGMRRLRVRGSPAVTLSVTFKTLAENFSRMIKHALAAHQQPPQAPQTARA